VLVESTEHALAMRRHLPGWTVVVGEQIMTEGLSQSDASRVSPVDANGHLLPQSAIITTSAMPKATWFDVIVRADAGIDLPALGGTHLLGHAHMDDGLLLIDFDDRHHPLARKWTRSRTAAYTAAGWYIAGGPLVYYEDRLGAANRIKQPVLPYQTPGEYRRVKGEYRTAKYTYEKRRARRREKLRQQDGGQITLKQIADPEHLVDCFRKLVQEGGPAAGIDGISPRNISMSDFGKIAGKLSVAMLEKRWQPQKTRPQPIPKPGANEKRILKIGVTLDRVVGKAVHESLQPFWELAKAWETSDPNMTAKIVLRGWINANGPAFGNGVTAIPDVLRLASGLGFRELPGADELTGWWEEAWERWLVCRRRARNRVLQRVRH
jgi:hypothetical protein